MTFEAIALLLIFLLAAGAVAVAVGLAVVLVALRGALQAEFTELDGLHKLAQEQLAQSIALSRPRAENSGSESPAGGAKLPSELAELAARPRATVPSSLLKRKKCSFCARIRTFFSARTTTPH